MPLAYVCGMGENILLRRSCSRHFSLEASKVIKGGGGRRRSIHHHQNEMAIQKKKSCQAPDDILMGRKLESE
jgi:hypothetical protein